MKKPVLLVLVLGSCAAGTALANPVVYMPYGTDATGTLDGTWNAYQRDAVGRTYVDSSAFAGTQNFQPTAGNGTNLGALTAGNLVAITSAAEQAGVAAVSIGDSWMGLNDMATEGTFQWVTGETLGYTAWNGGEPNDFNGAEDAAHVTGGVGGLWNDNGNGVAPQGAPLFGSIIEFRINIPNGIVTTLDAWRTTTYISTGAVPIDSAAAADALIGGLNLASSATSYYTHMNMTANGGEGTFPGDLGVFGTNGGDQDDYAVLSTGMLVITAADTYVFGTTSDDGARMRIDTDNNGSFDFILADENLQGQGPADLSAPIFLNPGLYPIDYRWWERAGGDGAELTASRNGGPFIVVGNDEGGGLNVVQVPEPAAASLGVLAFLGLLSRRRR